MPSTFIVCYHANATPCCKSRTDKPSARFCRFLVKHEHLFRERERTYQVGLNDFDWNHSQLTIILVIPVGHRSKNTVNTVSTSSLQ